MTHYDHLLQRAASYLTLMLSTVDFILMKPQHLVTETLVAGRQDEGYILVFDLVDDAQFGVALLSDNATLEPGVLGFLKLPVRQVQVALTADAHLIRVSIDDDILAKLPERKRREFGIELSGR